MPDRAKLENLRKAASEENFEAAARICGELELESRGTSDEFVVEELVLALRLRDAARVERIVEELLLSEE